MATYIVTVKSTGKRYSVNEVDDASDAELEIADSVGVDAEDCEATLESNFD